MNRVYPLTLTVCICMMVVLPRISFAQCNCAPGIPATAVVNTFTLAPTSQPSADLTFPQLDPSIGYIQCSTFGYTINGVTTTNVDNLAPSTALLPHGNPNYSPTGRLEYIFSLNIGANLTGPGINITKPYSQLYGPDSLGAVGQPDAHITYGPTQIIDNVSGSVNVSTNPAYTGNGTVTLSYSISGGLSTIKGGLNFNQNIQTSYSGSFALTYYWCPNAVLSTSIIDFTAVPNGHSVLLQWIASNQTNNTNYEIQISPDGKSFASLAQAESDPASTGTTAKYQYQYNADQTDVGKQYFRIKETNGSGQITYSKILLIDPNGNSREGGFVNYQVYPNPVVNTLVFQFNANQTGRYLLELVNTAGQVIQQKPVTLTGTSQIRLDLNPHPAKGLYFIRTTDLTHNQRYVSKVFIN